MRAQHESTEISRREALRRGLIAATAFAFAPGFGRPAFGASTTPSKAKAVIQIWMWGGPCHLDTFDPKPGAGYDFCGPLNKPISTKASGIQICELLPLLAQQADKYSIIRSMTHGSFAHETASYIVQTGHQPDRLVYPNMGAVVAMLKGYEHGYTGLIPPYVVLNESQGRFSEAGFLGERFKPFVTGGDPNQARFIVEGIVAPGITDERQQARKALLGALDTFGNAMTGNAHLERFDEAEARAYEMMFGETRKLFDLSQETNEVREKYGRNTFGQSCLMARRLVESGVPYVTINYKGWDTHKQHFEIMRRKLPEMDQGMATLIQDLSDRGLLDSTIVWWGGEFGRTPKIDWGAPWNGGRGHYGNCFCSMVAGGGFKGGHAVGKSSARGEEVADRPVYPHDLIRTMYKLMGIDPDSPLTNPQGLDTLVMPAKMEGMEGGGWLREIA
ncbi:MAG: DUF1501 domain-containing protein [Candidatus Hydrogenedentes bacterium]|nr:DUF1501 domain-containing protein [Candidatus Hydrogenedentota bacterium]